MNRWLTDTVAVPHMVDFKKSSVERPYKQHWLTILVPVHVVLIVVARLGEPDLPNTLRICREALSLPTSAETSDAHVDSVVDAVRQFFGTR
jgi:dTDP-4-amino-4,6-dideoxygalactose transaminase